MFRVSAHSRESGGGDGGNTSDLLGMSFPDTDSVDYTHKYYNTVFEVERARQTRQS